MRSPASRTIAGTVLVLLAGVGALTYRLTESPDHTPAAGTLIAVTERDFKVSAPARLSAGDYRLRIENKGPNRHELLVVRKPDSGPLQPRHDGLTIDEE